MSATSATALPAMSPPTSAPAASPDFQSPLSEEAASNAMSATALPAISPTSVLLVVQASLFQQEDQLLAPYAMFHHAPNAQQRTSAQPAYLASQQSTTPALAATFRTAKFALDPTSVQPASRTLCQVQLEVA